MDSSYKFLFSLPVVLALAFGLSPLRSRYPVLAAGVLGAGGAAVLLAVNALGGNGTETAWWKAAAKVTVSALLWASLAWARRWHRASKGSR